MRSVQQAAGSILRRSPRFHRSFWLRGGAIALSLLVSSTAMAAVAQTAPTSAPMAIAQATTLMFVNPIIGNDSSGNGSQSAPWRTITQALRVAPPNTTILLAAGTYSSESGETFPLMLKPGLTLQGDPSTRGRGVIIRGGGEYLSRTSASQNITILGANQAALSGVTVTNSNRRGYGLWVESTSPVVENNTFSGSTHDGISIVGSGSPLVRSNLFTQNGGSGITIFGSSQAEVRENIFENTGFGINIADTAVPRLLNNQIRQNRSGVVVQESARPILRGNTIENNQQDGLVAIAQSQPDLGTSAEPGNNVFRSNGHADINTSAARQPIATVGNQAANILASTGGSAIASQPRASAATPQAIAPSPLPARPALAPVPAQAPVQPPSRPVAPAAAAATSPEGSAFAALPQLAAAPVLAAPAQPPESATPNQYSSVRPTAPNATGWQMSQPAPAPAAVSVPVPTAPTRRSPVSATATPAPERSAVTVPTAPVAAAPAAGAPLREITVERQAAPPAARPVAPGPRPAAPAVPPQAPVQQATRSVPQPNANLLPVPSATIPMGNLGGLPTVAVSRNPLDRPASAPPAADGRQARALGLRYRVVVEANSDRDQAAVRSLVPGAFRISINGRAVMQVGAYSDRVNADDTAQMLIDNGFRASVQAIE